MPKTILITGASSGFGGSDAHARRDGGGSGAPGLAASLVPEDRRKLGNERQSRAAPKHLGAKVRGSRITLRTEMSSAVPSRCKWSYAARAESTSSLIVDERQEGS